MSHLDKVRNNVVNKGNSYGSEMEIINDKQIHEVILHRGCTSRFRENELITSVISCLNKKNIDFSVLDDETCCGIILYLLGDSKTADEVVKANIQKFNSHGVKKIITICPGCYEAFHDYYSKHENFDIEVIFAMDLFNDETIDSPKNLFALSMLLTRAITPMSPIASNARTKEAPIKPVAPVTKIFFPLSCS